MSAEPRRDEGMTGEVPRFSVILINYNGGKFLQGALDSLKRQSFRNFEVFVVDNASTDGSVDDLDTGGLPRFTLIRSPDNLGFAGGNNFVAPQASGEYLALLNPDAEAAADWLERVDAATRRHPGTAMFACLQLRLGKPDELDGIGDCYFVLGIPWRGGFARSAEEIPAEGTCFSPCGASAIYRRRLFLDVGGFPDRFFCYGEDTDLAFRLRARGHECIFLPDAIIHHEGGGLSGRASRFAVFHGARNRMWTFVRNMPGWSFWLLAPGHLFFVTYITLRAWGSGRLKDTVDGLVAGVTGIGPVWAERRALERARTVSTPTLLKAMSWKPGLMARRMGDVRPLATPPVQTAPAQPTGE